jgi:hypothetical protein
MVIMTREERKIADFLTEKKFKWKFQPSISVIDMGNRLKPFISDFYLIDLGIYLAICGAETNEHQNTTRESYEKNKLPIIYVKSYEDEDKWKHYLIRRIEEIQEKK